MQTIPVIEALRADLTYAARMLRKKPGFAATAVVTLALGILTAAGQVDRAEG